MVLQRTRPPLLETPFEVFDHGVFTPNDRFFVRWHWAVIPTPIDVGSFRLTVRGHVDKPLSLTLAEITARHAAASSWRRSTNAPAIRAASSRRASPAGNGATARWAMRTGPACGCATCWTAPA